MANHNQTKNDSRKLLKAIYDNTGGNTNQPANTFQIGNTLGFDDNYTNDLADHLIDNGDLTVESTESHFITEHGANKFAQR